MCNKNPKKIQNMFDEISSYYDKMNDIISFGSHYIIKKYAIQKMNIKPYSYVLDLCCGTGDITKIISKLQPKAKIIGLDISKNMISTAIKKSKQLGINQPFLIGDCTNLYFENNEFDFVTISFGLRNIENRQKAIQETFRVLKKNGKFLHLDFGKHNFLNKIFDIFVPILVKFNKKNMHHYNYLLKSKNNYPEPTELIKEFENEGFKFIEQYDFLFGAISAQIFKK